MFGYRKKDPVPDAQAESMVMEWSIGEPEPLRSRRDPYSYGEYTPATTPSGDILFTTRTVDPVAAAAEARRSGLWANTEITDTLWPASDSRTRPLMPLRRGHLAMLVAAGFLDNLVLEGDGRRILVKGRTSKEMEMVEDSPGEGGPPREAHNDRGGPRPGGRGDHRHRGVDGPIRSRRHEDIASFRTRRRYKEGGP